MHCEGDWLAVSTILHGCRARNVVPLPGHPSVPPPPPPAASRVVSHVRLVFWSAAPAVEPCVSDGYVGAVI